MSDRKAVIKNADMGEEMQQDAVDCATQALEKYNIEKVRRIDSPPHLPSCSLSLMSRDIETYIIIIAIHSLAGWLTAWLRQSIDLTAWAEGSKESEHEESLFMCEELSVI